MSPSLLVSTSLEPADAFKHSNDPSEALIGRMMEGIFTELPDDE